LAQFRIVPISEIASCPYGRLDPKHYIPKHNTLSDKLQKFLESLTDEERAQLNGLGRPTIPSVIQLLTLVEEVRT